MIKMDDKKQKVPRQLLRILYPGCGVRGALCAFWALHLRTARAVRKCALFESAPHVQFVKVRFAQTHRTCVSARCAH